MPNFASSRLGVTPFARLGILGRWPCRSLAAISRAAAAKLAAHNAARRKLAVRLLADRHHSVTHFEVFQSRGLSVLHDLSVALHDDHLFALLILHRQLIPVDGRDAAEGARSIE